MTGRKKVEYALYKGDDFINIGTKKELAELLGVKEDTIYFYSMPTYRKRGKQDDPNRYIVIKLD